MLTFKVLTSYHTHYRLKYSGNILLVIFLYQFSCFSCVCAAPVSCRRAQSFYHDHTSAEWSTLTLSGSTMNRKEAEYLEEVLLKAPDNFAAHIKLANYYFFNNPFGANQKKTEHILWIIQHYPASETAGSILCMPLPFLKSDDVTIVRKAWLAQTAKHPKNATILANAGVYLSLLHNKEALELLMKAHLLEPKNPKWFTLLGQHYKLQIRKFNLGEQQIKDNREYASKALTFYQSAFSLTKGDDERIFALNELPSLAFTAEQFSDAQKYSVLLLKTAQQYPKENPHRDSGVSTAQTVLGELELREGHIDQANQHLLVSANITQTLSDSLLPNMSLARELLKADQKQAVTEFLTRCKQFCKRAELDDWISEIERGLTPNLDSSPF